MNAATLIQRCSDAGIQLSADGDRLHVEATPGAITSELRDLLVNRKADLIDAMSGIRGRLLALAEAEGVDARLVHELATADMDGCAGLPDETLSAFLHARAASADRMAGRVPAGETQPIICARCGPVWSHPSVAAVLPMVDGWPRALGCPWCVVRAAGRFIPRPPVASATCMHWTPDTVNPDAGMGHCPCGHHYPGQRHTCADYRPQGQTTKETSS